MAQAADAEITHAASRNFSIWIGAPRWLRWFQNGTTGNRRCPVIDADGLSFATSIGPRTNGLLNEQEHIAALEKAAEDNPNDARSLVALANAYWLSGRGPEPVGELASRAIAADPSNRAGWHLWALSESDPRQRLGRWQQVSARFPEDDLARANVADNAASLAGAEHDYDALDLAIATYEQLLATAEHREQREALETALRSLRGWKF